MRFKHIEPKTLGSASEINALVIQALRFMGKQAVTQREIARIARVLSEEDLSNLLKDTQYSIDWIHATAGKIVDEAKEAR